MSSDFNLGNYEIDEDGNGNLVIKDSTGNVVLQHTDGGQWDIQRNISHNSNDINNVNLLNVDNIDLTTAIRNAESGGNQFEFDRIDLTDGGTQPVLLSGGVVSIIFVVGISEGDSATFITRGGFNEALEMTDPNNSFSTTQGTTGTNVFYDGSEYVIENQTGGSAVYDVFVLS